MPHNYATELESYLRQTSVSCAITTVAIDGYITALFDKRSNGESDNILKKIKFLKN